MRDLVASMSRPALLAALLSVLTLAEGCRAVEGIFKAGFWVGIVLAVIVVGIVFGIVRSIGS
jgi:hypothetical protein